MIGLLLGKLEQLDGGLGAGLEATPQRELVAQAFGFAEDFLGSALIVPEAGFADAAVQLGEVTLLYREVKDAPRSPGSC